MTGTPLPWGLKRRLPEGLMITAIALTLAVFLCIGCFLLALANAPEESVLQTKTITVEQVKHVFLSSRVTLLAADETYAVNLQRTQRQQLEQAVSNGEELRILVETGGKIWHISGKSGVILSFQDALAEHRDRGWRATGALVFLPVVMWAYVLRVIAIAREPSRYSERTLKRHWRR